jgi:hypothetical protein
VARIGQVLQKEGDRHAGDADTSLTDPNFTVTPQARFWIAPS